MPRFGRPRWGKYNAKRTVVDGITFASKKEARRYGELKLLVRARKIRNLRLQVPYDLEVNGAKICRYVADFVYREGKEEKVEDTKGVKTDVYKLKKKLMLACLGITITEV